MPTSQSSASAREARLDAVEDLRKALIALGEVDVALTLRAEQLSDEQSRGVLECILRDHLSKAIAELKDLARQLAAPRPQRRHRRPSGSQGPISGDH